MSQNGSKTSILALAALGIVYGDLGTSPLYAFNESLTGLTLNEANIYGVLSLILWTLILIISIKYLVFVVRADNDGEGGIIALTTLFQKYKDKKSGNKMGASKKIALLTIIGVGLILGDGMLTPAISVLSAVNGIAILSPDFKEFVIPITIGILIGLFSFQRFGTGKIGILFGPVILVWFATIGTLGFFSIIQNPHILAVFNPYYAVSFLFNHGFESFITLSGVFLCVTGGEALYADLGHFGKKAIRLSWFCVVLPGLFLNYLGQGAYIIANDNIKDSAFYGLSPDWFLPFLIVLATIATIIASQAIIAAVFSLFKQAIQLNLLPRLKILQTSETQSGQIYVPILNLVVGVGSCLLVLIFESTSKLSNAYGIAVNLDMMITITLLIVMSIHVWKLSRWVIALFFFFFIIDAAFLIGNLHKIIDGGWIPLAVAFGCGLFMYSWYKGFKHLRKLNYADAIDTETIINSLNNSKIRRMPGVGMFITDPYDQQGGSLLHHLKINKILPKTVIFVSVHIENQPYVSLKERFKIEKKAEGFYIVNLHFGFSENIHLPKCLRKLQSVENLPFSFNTEEMAYFIEIISVEISRKKTGDVRNWQKKLFAFMLRNSVPDIQYYHLPYNRTVALGTYYKL